MTKLNQVYKCNVCGNIVTVLHTGQGELVCCAQPMELIQEKKEDEGLEKHVPVVEKIEDGTKVKVGSEPHPMTDEHYIEWIEAKVVDGQIINRFLKPGDAPESRLCSKADVISARAYCNIHGLWKL